jgi:hypothetical protein
MHSVGLGEISQISAKKNFDKIFRASRPPDSALRTSAKVLENVASAQGKPQAVHTYRFLTGTT